MDMKIYTGTGDKGKTSLFSGERVPKSDDRIEAYGDIDELNSILGVVAAHLPAADAGLVGEIQDIQALLFRAGAWLATAPGSASARHLPSLDEDIPRFLEAAIDRMENELPPIREFILPGGVAAAALVHLARTVCRRAERHVIRLGGDRQVPAAGGFETIIILLNRLGDYLFVLARYLNHRQGVGDAVWKK